MKRERTVNNSIKYMIMGVVFIMTLIVLTQTTVLAAKSKSYSLVVSGAGTWNGDKDGMVKFYRKIHYSLKILYIHFAMIQIQEEHEKILIKRQLILRIEIVRKMIRHSFSIVGMEWRDLLRAWGFC